MKVNLGTQVPLYPNSYDTLTEDLKRSHGDRIAYQIHLIMRQQLWDMLDDFDDSLYFALKQRAGKAYKCGSF